MASLIRRPLDRWAERPRRVNHAIKPNFHTCQAALPEDPQNTAHFVSLGKIVVLNIGIL